MQKTWIETIPVHFQFKLMSIYPDRPTEQSLSEFAAAVNQSASNQMSAGTTQAATTRVLAAKALDEIYLMETPSWMFREEKAKTTFRKFCKRLRGIEKEMVQRNRGLKVPYTVLLPSKMPAGITI